MKQSVVKSNENLELIHTQIIFIFLVQIFYMIFSCQEYFMQFIQNLKVKIFFLSIFLPGCPRRSKWWAKKTKLQVFKMVIRNFIINIEINKPSKQMLLFLFIFYFELINCQPQIEDCKQYKIMKACQQCPIDMHEYSGNCIYNLPNCITHSGQNPFLCATCSEGYFLNQDQHCQEQKKQSEEYPIFPSTKYTQMNFDDNFTVELFRKIEQVMEQTANGQFYQVNTIFFYESVISQVERYMRLTSQEELGCLDQIYRLQISNQNLLHQELIYQDHLIVDQQFYPITDENDSSMDLLHRYKQSNPPEFRETFIVTIYKKTTQEEFIFILFNPNDKVIQLRKTIIQINFYIAQFAPENQKELANNFFSEDINQEDKQSIYNMIISTKSWEYLKNFTIDSFKKYLVFSKVQKLNQTKVYYYSVTLTIFENGTYSHVPVKFKKIQVNKDGRLRNYEIRYLGDELPTTNLSITLYCYRAKQFSLNNTLEKFRFQKNSTQVMNVSIYTTIIQLIRCSCLDNLFNQTQFSLRNLLVSYTDDQEYYYLSYNKLKISPYGPYVKHFIIEYDKQFGIMKLYSQYETVSFKAPNTQAQFHQSMHINFIQKNKKDQSSALSQLFAQKQVFLKKMRQDTLYSRNSRIKSFSNSSIIIKRQNGSLTQAQYVQIQLMYLPTPGVKQNQFPVYKNVTFRYAYLIKNISHLGYFVTKNDNYSEIQLLENELNEQKPKYRYKVCIGALIQIIKNKNITKDIGQWFLVRYYLTNSKNRFLLVTKFIFPIGFQKYVYYEVEVSRIDKNATLNDNSSLKDNQNKTNEENNKLSEQNLQYQIRHTQAGQVEDGIFGGLNIFTMRKINEFYNPPGKQKYVPTDQDLQNAIQGADKKIYVSYPISKDYTTINLIDELNTSCQDQVNHIYFNNTSYSISPVPMEIVFSDPRFIRIRQAIQLVYKNLSSYYLFYLRRVPTVTLVLKNNTNTYDKVFNPLLLQFQMVYINFTKQNKFVGLRIMAGYKWKSGQIIFSQFSQITIQQSTYAKMYLANQKQIIQSNSTYPRNVRSNYHVQKLYQNNRKKLYFSDQNGIEAELINSYECNQKYKDIVKLFETISKASIFSKQVTSICVNYPFLIIYHNSYSYNFSMIDNLPIVKVIPKPSFLSTTQTVRNLMRQTVAEYLCIDPEYIGKFNIGSKSSVMGIYDIVTVQFTIKTEEKWEIFRQEIIERFTFEVVSQNNKYLNLKQLPLLKVKQREIRSYGICEQINLNLTKKILEEPYLIPIQYTSSKFNQKEYQADDVEQKKSDLALKIYEKNLTERCKRYLFYGNFPTFQNSKLQKQIEQMNQKEQKNNTQKTKYFLSQRESEVTELFLKGNMITKIIFTNEGFYAQGQTYRNLSFPGIKQYIHPYLNQILNLYLDNSSKKTQQSQINLVYWKWKQYSEYLFLIELFYDTPSNYIIRIRVIARKPRKSETEIIYPVIEKLIVTQLEFIKKNANLNLLQQQKSQDLQNIINQIKSWKEFQIAQASLKSRYGMYFNSQSKIMNIKSIEKGNQLYFDVQYKTISGYFDAYLGYTKNNNSGRVIFFNVGKNQTFYNQTRNCKQYDSSNKCKKCDDRYFLYQDNCYPDFQGCLKQVSGICVYCRPEYKITSSYRCQ